MIGRHEAEGDRFIGVMRIAPRGAVADDRPVEQDRLVGADIGVVGLAVMGQNLVLNMNDHGYTVAVFNRTTSKVDDFLAQEARGTKVIGTHSLEELVAALEARDRRAWPAPASACGLTLVRVDYPDAVLP